MLIGFVAPALAQDYRVPLADDDVQYGYPTAYKDHGGVDWACGDVRYDGHQGTDIGIGGWAGMDAGRTIVAAASGVVIETLDGEADRCDTGDCGTNGYGNHVVLQHADGKTTIYGHMKLDTVAVALGQVVRCGDALGEVGSSGHSTGPHVHFGVWDPEAAGYVDPFWGDCSGEPSYWVDQGDYNGLPGTTCDVPPTCEPVATLKCGDHVERGATDAGTTATHAYYGACSEWAEYTGDETAFTVLPDRDGLVHIAMSGHTADLDLFAVQSDACDATDCLAAFTEGDMAAEALAIDGRQDEPFVVVIDGFRGAASGFVLDVTCDSEAPDTADSPADSANGNGGPGGCGCDASGTGGWMLGLTALALGRRSSGLYGSVRAAADSRRSSKVRRSASSKRSNTSTLVRAGGRPAAEDTFSPTSTRP